MATPAHSPESDNVYEKAYSVSTSVIIFCYTPYVKVCYGSVTENEKGFLGKSMPDQFFKVFYQL